MTTSLLLFFATLAATGPRQDIPLNGAGNTLWWTS